MPKYVFQNRTAVKLYVPEPVNVFLNAHGTATVRVPAAEMENIAIKAMVTRGLLSVAAADDVKLSDDLEVPVLSMITGGTTPVGPAGGDLTGTYPDPTLVSSGVAPGTYGGPALHLVLAVDAKGRITSASTTPALPGGDAGGDLTGTYPDPTLVATGVTPGTYGTGGNAIPAFNVDAKGRLLSVVMTPVAAAGGPAGGDLTGTYPDPTLVVTGVAPGAYGSGSAIPVVTVDAKGRTTAVTTTPIAAAGGPAGGDLTGTYPDPTLVSSGVAPGAYGSGTVIPVFSVDAKGRLVNAATTPVAATGGPAGGDLQGTYPNPLLASSGVTPGAYGASDSVPVITVDAKGRITSVTLALVAQTGLSYTQVTTNYITVIDDVFIAVDASIGPVTVTLHAASLRLGKRIHVKKIDNTANLVIVNTTGGDVVDNNPSFQWNFSLNGYIFCADGVSKWWIT